MNEFERYYDKFRDEVSDWTTDELQDEHRHLDDEQTHPVSTLAKMDAIRAELELRGEAYGYK